MPNKRYSSVIVTGSVAYDQIMNFPDQFVNHFHPEKLHQINVSFAVNQMERKIGGTGLNITYNIKLALNNPSIKLLLLAAIGKDGNEFIKFCRKNKIVTDGFIIDRRLYSATGVAITDYSDNQIWGFYYGACEKAKNIVIKKYLSKNPLLVISANHPDAFLNFQKQAIELKLDCLYDPGMSLTWISDDDLKKGVENCRFLVGNDYEIAMILKRIKKTVNQLIHLRRGYGGQGELAIITTLGGKGVRYEERVHPPSSQTNRDYGRTSKVRKVYKVHKVNAYKVKKVVDPTGAGDAWRGGFVAGLLEHKPIVDCLKLGNVMASFAIEKYGTVNHRPSKKEIEKRLKAI